MAEGGKNGGSGPRIDPSMFIYAIPGILLVGFFAWVLSQMGAQSGGTTLVRMVIGIAIVLGGGGLVYWLLGKLSNDD